MSARRCAVEACERRVRSLGLCARHYDRLKRHGDPLAGRVSPGVPLASLRAWVDSRDRGECWPWPWAQNGIGYGVVKFEGRYVVATQVALLLDGRSQQQQDHEAMHACDNPPCVNPDHLKWGTRAENMQQCHARGRWTRHNRPLGEKGPAAKLTAEQVIGMRRRYDSGESVASIARRYGIGKSQAHRVVKRQSWSHI